MRTTNQQNFFVGSVAINIDLKNAQHLVNNVPYAKYVSFSKKSVAANARLLPKVNKLLTVESSAQP